MLWVWFLFYRLGNWVSETQVARACAHGTLWRWPSQNRSLWPPCLQCFLLPVHRSCCSHGAQSRERRLSLCPALPGWPQAGLPAPPPAWGRPKGHGCFPRDGTTAAQQQMCSAMDFKGWEHSNYTHQLTQNILNNFPPPHFNSRLG